MKILNYFSKKILSVSLLLFLASLSFASQVIGGADFNRSKRSWPWDKINTEVIDLSHLKLMGLGTSAPQVESDCNDQYSTHEQKTINPKTGEYFLPELRGDACDHNNRYKEDIQLIKKTGANAYRFSIDWSKIEPEQGVFNQDALQHYRNVCEELEENGIRPVITIHHYAHPIWFEQMGAFKKEENIKYYVRFAEKLFGCLQDKVHMWLTFNSPGGYAMPAYAIGQKPPYKKNKQLAVQVLKNICEAHVQTYQKLKTLPGGKASKIGILKNICQLDPVYKFDPAARLYKFIGNRLVNDCFFDFFSKGIFNVNIPFLARVKHTNKKAPKSLDFIGINYYSHMGVKGFACCAYPGEMKVKKKNHTIYAEGMYRALKEVNQKVAKKLNIPIYITENGIAPLKEEDRDLFLKRYLYAISEAIKDGVDVRGYFYWSFMDNWEWGNYKDRYGLYHVDFKTQKRTLKKSADYFVKIANKFVTQKPEPKSWVNSCFQAIKGFRVY
ncbi:glycoside hydrolase family 1 protein [bacterium]|nr:glycoside hydrolase family 1 protein [bacterium]